MFAIPYYFDCTLQIFKKYHNEYINNFVKLSMDTLKEMKKNEEISKEKNYLTEIFTIIKDYIDGGKTHD